MRNAASILLGLALMSAASSPALAQQVYAGRGFVTAITAPCYTKTEQVEALGGQFNLTYYPIIAGQQNGPEALAFFNDGRAQLLVATQSSGSLNGSGTYNATKISADAEIFYFSGSYDFTITTISASALTLAGTVTNAWDIAGCKITFQSVLGLRPNT
jgi:hypothetical protein